MEQEHYFRRGHFMTKKITYISQSKGIAKSEIQTLQTLRKTLQNTTPEKRKKIIDEYNKAQLDNCLLSMANKGNSSILDGLNAICTLARLDKANKIDLSDSIIINDIKIKASTDDLETRPFPTNKGYTVIKVTDKFFYKMAIGNCVELKDAVFNQIKNLKTHREEIFLTTYNGTEIDGTAMEVLDIAKEREVLDFEEEEIRPRLYITFIVRNDLFFFKKTKTPYFSLPPHFYANINRLFNFTDFEIFSNVANFTAKSLGMDITENEIKEIATPQNVYKFFLITQLHDNYNANKNIEQYDISIKYEDIFPYFNFIKSNKTHPSKQIYINSILKIMILAQISNEVFMLLIRGGKIITSDKVSIPFGIATDTRNSQEIITKLKIGMLRIKNLENTIITCGDVFISTLKYKKIIDILNQPYYKDGKKNANLQIITDELEKRMLENEKNAIKNNKRIE